MLRSKTLTAEFDRVILPHLPSAYNLARWLLGARAGDAADDVVQESCVRAFRHFQTFRSGDSRAWFMSIVRNCVFTHIRRSTTGILEVSLDEMFEDSQHAYDGPEPNLMSALGVENVRLAIEKLPVEFREVIILKDMDEFTYREISEITELPLGTVMSRLSRGRRRLRALLCEQNKKEADDVV